MIRTYTELSKIDSFEGRFQYLKLSGQVGSETFGFDRYLNQIFYVSGEWKRVRDFVIVRDNGLDLAFPDHQIFSTIIVHHMNQVTLEDIVNRNPEILDPEFLICVSDVTHKAIHYGDENLLPSGLIERNKNDTCPWKK